jgi:hypothetical protein
MLRHSARAAAIAAGLALAPPADANTIVAGFNLHTVPCNDDGSITAALGFGFNFFGQTYTSTFVNTNGNVTFDSPLSTFTPFGLLGTNRRIIAPFFADVDTRNPQSGVVTLGTGSFGGRSAFGVNWLNVGYYNTRADKLNSFQLLLVDRSDIAAGDADIYFNYGQIAWETGEASGGRNGLGGSSARAGYSNGTNAALELAGSGINGAFLDGGPNALADGSNIGVDGRFLFIVRSGVVTGPDPDPVPVPEPTALAVFGAGLMSLALLRRRL